MTTDELDQWIKQRTRKAAAVYGIIAVLIIGLFILWLSETRTNESQNEQIGRLALNAVNQQTMSRAQATRDACNRENGFIHRHNVLVRAIAQWAIDQTQTSRAFEAKLVALGFPPYKVRMAETRRRTDEFKQTTLGKKRDCDAAVRRVLETSAVPARK